MKMNQIFHIFRKDARHHWMVILPCQAALAAYCWEEVHRWSDPLFDVTALPSFIRLLLPLTWCFLVFRVVQGETLVGDRQFWVTRPYEWKKLLAAKILFVLVFLNLPLLIAGAVLLAKAGFSPAPHVLGLLWMQLLLFQLPFLPLLALAGVTRNLAQALLTLLTMLVLMFAIAAFPVFFSRKLAHFAVGLSVAVPRVSSDFQELVLLFVCVAALGLQYARRKTAQSRLWLAGGIVVAVTISMLSAYAKRNKDPYPAPERQTIAFHAGLDPVKSLPPKRQVEKDESVPIGIPVSAWGVPPNSLGWARGMRMVLEAPDGFRWDGRWPGNMQLLGPGDNRWRAIFDMDYETYQRLKSVPLKAHVSMSVDVFREHDFENITATGGEFEVPRVGRCRVWRRDGNTLRCNSPLVQPAIVVVRMDPALSTCVAEEAVPPAIPPEVVEGLPYAWQRGRDSELPESGISPVASSFFYFWAFLSGAQICPGTPLNFSFPEFTENVRSDFEIANLNLDDYRQTSYAPVDIKGPNGIKRGLQPPPR